VYHGLYWGFYLSSVCCIYFIIVPEENENTQLAKCLVTSIKLCVSRDKLCVFSRQVQTIFGLARDGFISCQSYNAFLIDSVKQQIKADHLDPKPEFINKVCPTYSSTIPVGKIAKKKTVWRSALLIPHSKYSAILSKLHSYGLLFQRFCPLGFTNSIVLTV